jgi:hypothetical protein
MKSLSRTIWAHSLGLSLAALLPILGSLAYANDNDSDRRGKLSVDPGVFDPSRTDLVAARWIDGIGCPTGAKQVLFDLNPPYDLLPPSAFTDAACPTGDAKDRGNGGLLLAKTGETLNNAAGTATLKGVKGIVLSEIGYDIRGGSWCGAGAPRFNITTTNGKFYFLACSSPAPDSTPSSSSAWRRLRWGTGVAGSVSGYRDGVSLEAITDPVKSISIIFDEGQYFTLDTVPPTPDPYGNGLAVLDNIDVNGTLVGRGANDDHD